MPSKILIKLGGAALQNISVVNSICRDLVQLQKMGIKIVIVHGGGPAINSELSRRGIQWEFLEGQRVTTAEMMETIEMVLCGVVNRQIVRTLNGMGGHAIGLSGTDDKMLLCVPADPQLGRVGVIKRVETGAIDAVLNHSDRNSRITIPVIAPIGIGNEGEAYNVNADWAASWIARALGIKTVLFLTDQDGILDLEKKRVPHIDLTGIENLITGKVVTGGMLTKTRAIHYLIKNGAREVYVRNARHPIFFPLDGTVCLNEFKTQRLQGRL